MPIKKSAFKALRQAKKRETRNKKIKMNLEYQERQFRKALALNDLEKAKEIYQVLQKALDKAAGKGIIKKNKAARKKSRLSSKIRPVKSPAEIGGATKSQFNQGKKNND